MFDLEGDKGSLITDIAVQGFDTLAVGREDGTVTVITLMNQCRRSHLLQEIDQIGTLIGDKTQFYRHSDEPISKIIYVGPEYNAYCCASGTSIHNGLTNMSCNLGREVTHLASCIEEDGHSTIAAGLGKCGQIQMIDFLTMTPLFTIASEHV